MDQILLKMEKIYIKSKIYSLCSNNDCIISFDRY